MLCSLIDGQAWSEWRVWSLIGNSALTLHLVLTSTRFPRTQVYLASFKKKISEGHWHRYKSSYELGSVHCVVVGLLLGPASIRGEDSWTPPPDSGARMNLQQFLMNHNFPSLRLKFLFPLHRKWALPVSTSPEMLALIILVKVPIKWDHHGRLSTAS